MPSGKIVLINSRKYNTLLLRIPEKEIDFCLIIFNHKYIYQIEFIMSLSLMINVILVS